MTLQSILLIVSVVFFVLAVVFIGLAVFIFFFRNVPDVRADLSGKKRAEAVEAMRNTRPGRERRKGVAARAEATSGSLTEGDSSMIGGIRSAGSAQQVQDETAGRKQSESGDSSASKPSSLQSSGMPKKAGAQAGAAKSSAKAKQKQKQKQQQQSQPKSELQDDSSETTILADDTSSTTILEDDTSATTVLSDVDSSTDSIAGESSSSAASATDRDSSDRVEETEAQTEGEFDVDGGTVDEEQSSGEVCEPLQPVQQAASFEIVDKIILTGSTQVVRYDKGEVVRVTL